MTEASTQTEETDYDESNENAAANAQSSQSDTESPNRSASTSRQVSRQPSESKLFLVNRVNYFCFLISLFAPLLNFYLWKVGSEYADLGIALDLMLWILFGIFWCGGFATLMGPIFSLVAAAIRVLDIVPGLGSSLWIVLSIWLTTAVLNDMDTGFPAFLNNLPLFSLIIANYMATALNLQLEVRNIGAHHESPYNGDELALLFSSMIYSFVNGKCRLTHETATTPPRTLTRFSFLSVSEEFLAAYKAIREKSVMYLRGENPDEFSSSFDNWRSEARRMRRTLLLRRLFCLLGYIAETVALYFSFALLNHIKSSVPNDKEDTKQENDTIELFLPFWQIVFVAMLSCLSHYLWVLINIESTCTSPAEVSSLMLGRVESRINWSGPKSGFLDNGKRKWSVLPRNDLAEIRAGELPTIGIVGDENELDGTRRLRSVVTGCEFTVRRIASDTIRLQLAREDEREREALYPETVETVETDKVT